MRKKSKGIRRLTANQNEDAVWKTHFEELCKAVDRVGTGPEMSMLWFLQFAKTDLSGLSSGDWSNLRYEIEALTRINIFSISKNTMAINSIKDWTGLASPDEIRQSRSYAQVWALQKLPSVKAAYTLQDKTRDHIYGIIDNGKTALHLSKLHIHIFDMDRTGRATINDSRISLGWGKRLSCDSIESIFGFRLIELLAQFAPRIRRCPECTKVNLADRRNQKFCSVKCQSRSYMRKYRDTPPDRIGKPGRPKGWRKPSPQAQTVIETAKKKGGYHGTKTRKR